MDYLLAMCLTNSEHSFVLAAEMYNMFIPVMTDDFTCDVQPDGEITIKGVTSTGQKKVRRNSMYFEMQTQNLCPAGEFSISFHLPGPIDDEKPIKGVFGSDGIFEAIVKKTLPAGRRVG